MVLPVIYQLLTMIILMIVGIILFKYNYLTPESSKGLSVVLTRISAPCNMVILMQREYSKELFIEFINLCMYTFIALIIISILFYIIGRFLKLDLSNTGLLMSAGSYSNVIFMGQPLILAMYGEEGLFYCVAVLMASSIYLSTACAFFFGMGKERKKLSTMLKDMVTSLVFLSSVLGTLLFVFSIKLPKPIYDAFNYSAVTTVCLSMIYLGTLLAMADIKEVFKDKTVYIFSFCSLIVTPILIKFLLSPFLSGLPFDVLIILLSTPAAAALPSFAELYNNNEKRASEFVFISTILSVITLPFVAGVIL